MSVLAPAGSVTAEPAGGGLVTEYAFTLPRGYVDENGQVHREGIMRAATARDEIFPLRDPRVRDHEAYLTVLLLSRVVTRIGGIAPVTTGVVEGMFATDLAFLQRLYKQVNSEGGSHAAVQCPACNHAFEVDLAGSRPGES